MKLAAGSPQRALRTPRSAAISGIVFSLLLTATTILVRLSVLDATTTQSAWVADPARRTAMLVAVNLVPFAGIAFLWFIGVVRDRMGQREDRFFATVFLGSGLLFVAMLFAATAVAASPIANISANSGAPPAPDTWQLARLITYTLITTYAMRMAAVFMIATATITLRIAIMPMWIAVLGYACALALLFSAGFLPWIELLFPIWVFLVSMQILLTTMHTSQKLDAEPSRNSDISSART